VEPVRPSPLRVAGTPLLLLALFVGVLPAGRELVMLLGKAPTPGRLLLLLKLGLLRSDRALDPEGFVRLLPPGFLTDDMFDVVRKNGTSLLLLVYCKRLAFMGGPRRKKYNSRFAHMSWEKK
jgi:hypothetical protein